MHSAQELVETLRLLGAYQLAALALGHVLDQQLPLMIVMTRMLGLALLSSQRKFSTVWDRLTSMLEFRKEQLSV
jgi:hypothetical protein